MSFRKLILIFRRRWWALVALAVVGFISGFALSAIRNQGLEPLYRAEASVVLARQSDDDSGRLLQSQLNEFQRTAFRVNQELVQSDEAEITATTSETEGQLLFVGYGPNENEAAQTANTMRSRYLEAAPIGVQAVDQNLADYAAQVAEIRQEIQELARASETQVDPESELETSFLTAAINQLQGQAVQLATDLILYDFREVERAPSEIERELRAIQDAIADLQAQLEDLQATEPVEAERDLRAMALQQQESQLTEAYLELFLNQAESAALTSVGPLTTNEVSPTPVPPIAAGVGGLVLALVIGLVSALLFDFIRKPVWSAADLNSVPTMGILAPRDSERREMPWYLHAADVQRLDDIQAIRATLEGATGANPATIGVARLGASAEETRAAAADLAASLAAIGKSVLLFDCDFGSRNGLPEFGSVRPTFSDLLVSPTDRMSSRATVRETLESLNPVMPGLRGMPSGDLDRHPTDVLGGPDFEMVVDASRSMANVSIFVSSEATNPSALTIAQRLDHMILIAKTQASSIPEVEGVAAKWESRNIRLLGVVLLDASQRTIREKVRTAGVRLRNTPKAMRTVFKRGSHS